jgi:hypothetical protein
MPDGGWPRENSLYKGKTLHPLIPLAPCIFPIDSCDNLCRLLVKLLRQLWPRNTPTDSHIRKHSKSALMPDSLTSRGLAAISVTWCITWPRSIPTITTTCSCSKRILPQKFPRNIIKVEANYGWYGVDEQLKLAPTVEQNTI